MSQFTIVKTQMSVKGECAFCGDDVEEASHLWIEYSANASDESESVGTIHWAGFEIHLTATGPVCDRCAVKRHRLIKEKVA